MNEISVERGPRGAGKWGDVARAGFQIFPDVLLVKQRELGLDSTDLVVLLNLNSYWWFRDVPPYARNNVIAKRMGVTSRTVQRSISKMEAKGYIKRGKYQNPDTGDEVKAVFMITLAHVLNEIARKDAVLSAKMDGEESGLNPGELSFSEADEVPF